MRPNPEELYSTSNEYTDSFMPWERIFPLGNQPEESFAKTFKDIPKLINILNATVVAQARLRFSEAEDLLHSGPDKVLVGMDPNGRVEEILQYAPFLRPGSQAHGAVSVRPHVIQSSLLEQFQWKAAAQKQTTPDASCFEVPLDTPLVVNEITEASMVFDHSIEPLKMKETYEFHKAPGKRNPDFTWNIEIEHPDSRLSISVSQKTVNGQESLDVLLQEHIGDEVDEFHIPSFRLGAPIVMTVTHAKAGRVEYSAHATIDGKKNEPWTLDIGVPTDKLRLIHKGVIIYANNGPKLSEVFERIARTSRIFSHSA